MTQTSYTAWDGNLYEWPPPDDWYQADDGRWWPEGYGPRAASGGDTAIDAETETEAVTGVDPEVKREVEPDDSARDGESLVVVSDDEVTEVQVVDPVFAHAEVAETLGGDIEVSDIEDINVEVADVEVADVEVADVEVTETETGDAGIVEIIEAEIVESEIVEADGSDVGVSSFGRAPDSALADASDPGFGAGLRGPSDFGSPGGQSDVVDFGPSAGDWSAPERGAADPLADAGKIPPPPSMGGLPESGSEGLPDLDRPNQFGTEEGFPATISGDDRFPAPGGVSAPEFGGPAPEFGGPAPEVGLPAPGFERGPAGGPDSGPPGGSGGVGPGGFPAPSIGSAPVFSGPDSPDGRSEPPSNPLGAPGGSPDVGDLPMYPTDLTTGPLPAGSALPADAPSIDSAPPVGGPASDVFGAPPPSATGRPPIVDVPSASPPSLANPTFSGGVDQNYPRVGAAAPTGLNDPTVSGGLTGGMPETPERAGFGNGAGPDGGLAPPPQTRLPSYEDVDDDFDNAAGGGRRTTLLFLLAGLVLAAIALYLGSRLLFGSDSETVDGAASTEASTEESGEESGEVGDSGESGAADVQDSEDESDPAVDSSGQTAGAAAEGTFSNPHRSDLGIDINYVTADGDRAWRVEVRSTVTEAEDAGTPPEGMAFATAEILVRNQQPGSSLPVNTLQFNVATESGDVITWADAACTSGSPLDVDAVLDDGDSAQGTLCWEVPADSIDDLLLRVETDEVSGQVFIELNDPA